VTFDATLDLDGVWHPEWAVAALRVHGFFWEHPLFPVAVAALLLAIGFLVHRRRLRAAHLLQQRLEKMVSQRTEELAYANRQLERLASVDGLTQLANRRTFDSELERLWRTTRRLKGWIGLVMVDIDHFKAYNDTLGHQAGDACLRRVAMILSEAVPRAGDLVARYGGEEFAILLPATDPDGALRVARRIVRLVRQEGIPHPASRVAPVVTVSTGAAAISPDADDPGQLVARAHEALYRAKKNGRDRAELRQDISD